MLPYGIRLRFVPDFLGVRRGQGEEEDQHLAHLTAIGEYASGQGKAVAKERQVQRETGKMNEITVF
jgi:hypothetical protein